ncbi:MAG: hypothetical protein SF052_20610 [Bacteroidia bacterium]|nr:hypothetical protein [Bacteroidia bacterium]
MNPIPEYEAGINSLSAQLKILDRQYNLLSWARLGGFLGAIGLDYLLFQWTIPAGLAGGLVLLVLFLYLIRWHSQVAEKREHNQRLLVIHQAEIHSLKGQWKDRTEGAEFRDYDHPYSYDLDIFGRGSVFQYINRTGTAIGRKMLADGLKNPLQSADEIRLRQEAIADLAQKPAWNLNFQALGMGKTDSEENSRFLLQWLEEKPYFITHPLYSRLIVVMPVLFGVSLLFWLIPAIPALGISRLQLPGSVPLLFFLINLGIVGLNLGRVGRQQVQVGKKAEMLRKYADLLGQIETESFSAPLLKRDREVLLKKDFPASEKIQLLGELTYMLDQRLNAFMGLLLNGVLLWDIRYVSLLEKWRETHKTELPAWFDIISRWDALGSMGRFYYNHPDLVFPEVSEGPFFMNATQLGHPLIDAGIRINNDVDLTKPGEFLIITGANMAGKSTFLRTVGVNLILAMNGAPVCAQKYAFAPIEMITSVRTQDSLSDNESYFYAELKQLKKIIDKLKQGRPVFVIVDEMLRGTNSKDKMVGSRKFIEQLIHLRAVGLVATHDLSLGKLAEDYPEYARNKRFEVEISGDQLTFDYKLLDGISQNLNATFLMQKMGIMP